VVSGVPILREYSVTLFFSNDQVRLYHADCCLELARWKFDVVHSIVTDPPYGLKFMGKDWDHGVPGVPFWVEALRVLKPGGYLLAFGGTRTYHRLACAIEDAGFEIRDCLMWLYGSGFPKSLDVSKAIDKAAGAERVDLGPNPNKVGHSCDMRGGSYIGEKKANMAEVCRITAPSTPEAKQWDGWGTALKPAYEPIILARKPLVGTVAANVLAHGTGGLNVDGCRVGTFNDGAARANTPGSGRMKAGGSPIGTFERSNPSQGRWPANVILDEEVGRMLDEQSGISKSSGGRVSNISKTSKIYGGGKGLGQDLSADAVRGDPGYGDKGGASRFFYCAKASKKERNQGLPIGEENKHPTVKPIALMRYLVRLVTPPGGTVLDIFLGSGSTAVAALQENCNVLGIDKDADSLRTASYRIQGVANE
jgi:DNA modification methylase